MPDLFREPTTPRTGPLARLEAAVHWFTDSTRPEAAASRRTVNRWYEDFPDPDSKFAAVLLSQVNEKHYQALDELHVHALLRRGHSDVRYEEGGAGPDFRVYDKGVLIAGVEVASLFQQSLWTADERRHARLADEVDRRLRPDAGYFVMFQIDAADRDPAPRRFVDWLSREIAQLPPHDDRGSEPLPEPIYIEGGIRIRVRFVPMFHDAPAKSDPDARIVGGAGVIGGVVRAGTRLKDRVESKAGGRYDLGGAPYLVTVGVHDSVCSDYQVVDGLYGGESVDLGSNQIVRRQDGLFGIDPTSPSGRHTRLSAVAVVRELKPWSPDDADVAILQNPYAARELPDGLIPATRRFGVVSGTASSMTLDWS